MRPNPQMSTQCRHNPFLPNLYQIRYLSVKENLLKYSLKICIGHPLDSIYENIVEINLDHLNISNCEY